MRRPWTGLEALLTEFERARRNGFTASEFERAKQDILRFYESANKERKTSESSSYANEYVDLFLKKIASPGIEYEYPLVQRLLPGITLDDAQPADRQPRHGQQPRHHRPGAR